MTTYDSSVNQIAQSPTNPDATTETTNNYLIDDYSGFKIPVSEGLVEEWGGLMTTADRRSPRHPQDFVRARQESHKGSPRPEQPDTFLDTPDALLQTHTGDNLTTEAGINLIVAK